MYKRIIILGGSGSGKSSLARRISEYTGYSVYHLDNLYLDLNFQKKNINELKEISKQFLSKDTGVVDGNYKGTLPERINWADLIVFIDVPTRVHVYRIFKRMIMVNLGLEKRHGQLENGKNILNISFIKWVYFWNKVRRDKVLSMLGEAKDKKVIIIKKPRELDLKTILEN